MLKNYQELELYSQLQKAKEELFSCFRQIVSPSSLPETIEYEIRIDENEENYECIRAFCIFYEGLYFEELSLRANDDNENEEGYILVWYKDLEGLDLRDKVLCQEIK
ncbi:MAG: hypothetical protein IKK43_04605 [Clostridia bacterium]|nr:hypothetical protein [Clostridia bacterium]